MQMDQTKLVMDITAQTGVAFHRASSEDLALLKKLGAPEEVLDFFAYHEPIDCAEISGARLWPIAELIHENSDYVPGADLHPRGFLVIATNECGDSFCIDLSVQEKQFRPVLIMSHELSWEEMSDEEVRALRKEVAESFIEFLEFFAAGRLEKEPFFEPPAG
jgi:hypothetical protein